MQKIPDKLPEALIVDCAERLGASTVPIAKIQKAWKSVVGFASFGCLNNENGQRLFIAYRLRELGCFRVGCKSEDETGTGCFFHFFDIYYNSKNLTDAEYAAFMNSRAKYRQDEASVAASKLWKLIDSHPINVVAARVASPKKSKGTNQ